MVQLETELRAPWLGFEWLALRWQSYSGWLDGSRQPVLVFTAGPAVLTTNHWIMTKLGSLLASVNLYWQGIWAESPRYTSTLSCIVSSTLAHAEKHTDMHINQPLPAGTVLWSHVIHEPFKAVKNRVKLDIKMAFHCDCSNFDPQP